MGQHAPAPARGLLHAAVLLSLLAKTTSQTYYASCSEAKSRGGITGATHVTNMGEVYCDQDTHDGGWMLVANIKNTGNWAPYNSNLAPTFSHGTYSKIWDKTTDYYKAFNVLTSADDYKYYLFMSGNRPGMGLAWKPEAGAL